VREWEEAHPDRIQFHWLSTNNSWLNLIESYFSTFHKVDQNVDQEAKTGQAIKPNYLK